MKPRKCDKLFVMLADILFSVRVIRSLFFFSSFTNIFVVFFFPSLSLGYIYFEI